MSTGNSHPQKHNICILQILYLVTGNDMYIYDLIVTLLKNTIIEAQLLKKHVNVSVWLLLTPLLKLCLVTGKYFLESTAYLCPVSFAHSTIRKQTYNSFDLLSMLILYLCSVFLASTWSRCSAS